MVLKIIHLLNLYKMKDSFGLKIIIYILETYILKHIIKFINRNEIDSLSNMNSHSFIR